MNTKIRVLPAALLLALAFAGPAPAEPGEPAPGGSLDRVPRTRILALAREIDRLVEADLAAKNLKPNAPLDEPSFLRRAYVSLAGRIPTVAETDAYLSSSAPARREDLVDRLLESPAWASHLFNSLAEMLRLKSRLQNNISGEPYIHFVKESLAKNKPWDVFVRELLTASGPAHQRGNGATGYYLRDRGMPEDNMSNTITLFLGTRLECAQCHNHPFDTWTQKQYHEMVAFTGGMRFTNDGFMATDEGKRLKAIGDAFRTGSEKGKENLAYREFRKILQPLDYGISGSGTGLYKLPKDYQYNDASPNQVVKARAMFGPEVALAADPEDAKDPKKGDPKKAGKKGAAPIKAPEVGSREAYARWLASPENPRFTTVIANRMWKSMFGLGVIEPAYNLRADTKAVNPPLLAHLESAMKELGYDLKQYVRVLANSRTWQREASRTEPSEDEPYRFPGPLLRRMAAEQLWDSMLTLVVPDVDSTLSEPGAAAEAVYKDYERLSSITGEQAKTMVELEVLRQKDPAKYKELKKEQMETAKADPANEKKIDELQEAAKAARKAGNEAEVKRIREELQALTKGAAMDAGKKGYRKAGDGKGLVRASDMPQPAPPGHFLREWGQSDREQIDAAHTDSTVPQALSLLNGYVDKNLLPNAKAALRAAADAVKDPEAKLRTVFRGILTRDPLPAEKDTWMADLGRRGDAALKDLVWTLVNTHEFMFIR